MREDQKSSKTLIKYHIIACKMARQKRFKIEIYNVNAKVTEEGLFLRQ